MAIRGDGHRTRPGLDSVERQRIQRGNQIFLRLKKQTTGKCVRRELEEELGEKGGSWAR